MSPSPLSPSEAFDVLRELADGTDVSAEVCARLRAYVEELEMRLADLEEREQQRGAA